MTFSSDSTLLISCNPNLICISCSLILYIFDCFSIAYVFSDFNLLDFFCFLPYLTSPECNYVALHNCNIFPAHLPHNLQFDGLLHTLDILLTFAYSCNVASSLTFKTS
ncbi:hypothetical protein ATANTOWER_025651 [Ataeniobius toweri]|uniref:Uncharacterized protein n=1 Tax=Ataeniobius toweri TaxID=208326 RepID=A0ABU7AGZ3_9TELE|nr:hypothetical protein [Ataeniobius toweri]